MKLFGLSLFVLLLGLTGCYQVDGGDDLRTVPVTNNPNIVPQNSRIGTPSY